MTDKWNPGHYLILAYTQRAADNLTRINSQYIAGCQCNYRWRDLEPTEGSFNFASLTADLAALAGAGKKMVLQLRDKYDTELPTWVAVSSYVKTDAAGKKEIDWENTTARSKLLALHTALAAHCDANAALVGVTLKETAAKTLAGVTAGYTEAAKAVFGGALSVFQTTPVFMYINWSVNMDAMAQFVAANQRAGWGGPDVICVDSLNRNPVREANNPEGPPSYPYFTSLAGKVPLCCAVQSPSLCGKETAFELDNTKYFTAQELFEQGVDAMNLTYMFWDQWAPNSCPTNWDATCRPYIESQSGRITTTRPDNLDGGDPIPDPIVRGPYQGVTRQIPGTIPAVAFDAMTQGSTEVLGQGATYNETTAALTWGSPPRYVEGVYPQTASNDGSRVRQNKIGEWREYTVSIAQTGTYIPSITICAPTAPASPAVRFSLDGSPISDITLGATGDWTYANRQTFSGSPVALTAAASAALRVEILSEGWDYFDIGFELTEAPPVDPPDEPDPPTPGVSWSRKGGKRVLVIGPFGD